MNELNNETTRRTLLKNAALLGLGSVAAAGGIAALTIDNFGKKGRLLGKEFEYDIQSLLHVNPALIHFQECAPKINTGFNYPRSIALDANDNIYVTGGQSVTVFNANGNKLPVTIETENAITSIFIDKTETIYLGVGDYIEVYDLAGKKISQWQSAGPKASINSIVAYQENVMAADAGKKVIHHYDRSGNRKNTFGDFVIPSSYIDMGMTSDSHIAVSNPGKHRVEYYSTEGDLMSWWGEFSMSDISGFCGCCNPVSLAVLPNDAGFITCEKGITRIKHYDRNGNFVGVVAAPNQFLQHDLSSLSPLTCFNPYGMDVAVDSQSRVIVLDPVPGEIRFFSRHENEQSVG